MTYSRGLPLGKEKDGIADYGVKSIVIMHSIMRILDKIGMDNVPESDRKKAMGKYQMIGTRQGCEISTVALDFGLDFIAEHEEFGAINIDAANAYSSMSQQKIYEAVCEEIPDFINVFKFLYEDNIICDIDHKHRIYIKQGLIQGLRSSEILYSMGKRRIMEKVAEKMENK